MREHSSDVDLDGPIESSTLQSVPTTQPLGSPHEYRALKATKAYIKAALNACGVQSSPILDEVLDLIKGYSKHFHRESLVTAASYVVARRVGIGLDLYDFAKAVRQDEKTLSRCILKLGAPLEPLNLPLVVQHATITASESFETPHQIQSIASTILPILLKEGVLTTTQVGPGALACIVFLLQSEGYNVSLNKLDRAPMAYQAMRKIKAWVKKSGDMLMELHATKDLGTQDGPRKRRRQPSQFEVVDIAALLED